MSTSAFAFFFAESLPTCLYVSMELAFHHKAKAYLLRLLG
jgi:hypothetical protein